MKFVLESLYVMLFKNYEFTQNRYIESHTLRRACIKVCPVVCSFHSLWLKLVIEDIPYGFEELWVS